MTNSRVLQPRKRGRGVPPDLEKPDSQAYNDDPSDSYATQAMCGGTSFRSRTRMSMWRLSFRTPLYSLSRATQSVVPRRSMVHLSHERRESCAEAA